MTLLTAKDIMTNEPIWVPEDMFVSELIGLFRTKMISGAPVVDDENALCGVVSLRDIAFYFANEKWDKQVGYVVRSELASLTPEEWDGIHMESQPDLMVRDIMTPLVFTVDIDTPIPEIADKLLKGRIHRLVVMDGDVLAGMITTMDMLKILRSTAEACSQGQSN